MKANRLFERLRAIKAFCAISEFGVPHRQHTLCSPPICLCNVHRFVRNFHSEIIVGRIRRLNRQKRIRINCPTSLAFYIPFRMRSIRGNEFYSIHSRHFIPFLHLVSIFHHCNIFFYQSFPVEHVISVRSKLPFCNLCRFTLPLDNLVHLYAHS